MLTSGKYVGLVLHFLWNRPGSKAHPIYRARVNAQHLTDEGVVGSTVQLVERSFGLHRAGGEHTGATNRDLLEGHTVGISRKFKNEALELQVYFASSWAFCLGGYPVNKCPERFVAAAAAHHSIIGSSAATAGSTPVSGGGVAWIGIGIGT